MSKIALDNGIVLDSVGPEPFCFARSLNEYAQRLGLNSIRVFLAKSLSGSVEYLIVDGEAPVYASTSYEAICARLDIIRLQKEVGR